MHKFLITIGQNKMKFLIKFPTRSRPEAFFITLNKYIENFSSKNEYIILISCDIDDLSMNNMNVINRLNSYANLKYFYSKRTTKIDAINRDIDKIEYDWDVLISAADDMIPIVKDYDLKIQSEMINSFPDLDGCLWFFDGTSRQTNTQTIMGKKYYDRSGWIYYPKYKTWYCDNEHTEYCLSIRKLKFVDECIILHQHPGHRPGLSWDQLYIENDDKSKVSHDKELYEYRKTINFDPKK